MALKTTKLNAISHLNFLQGALVMSLVHHWSTLLCRIVSIGKLDGLRVWTLCLKSCLSISVGFKSKHWLWLSEIFHFVFLLVFHRWTCFWDLEIGLMSTDSPSAFSERKKNSWLPSITASHQGSEAAKQPHTITLPPLCLTLYKVFVSSGFSLETSIEPVSVFVIFES